MDDPNDLDSWVMASLMFHVIMDYRILLAKSTKKEVLTFGFDLTARLLILHMSLVLNGLHYVPMISLMFCMIISIFIEK